jgi:hypothetical protein
MNRELRDGLSWLYHNDETQLKLIQYRMRDMWGGASASTKQRQVAFQIRKNSGKKVEISRISQLICMELERENPDIKGILSI